MNTNTQNGISTVKLGVPKVSKKSRLSRLSKKFSSWFSSKKTKKQNNLLLEDETTEQQTTEQQTTNLSTNLYKITNEVIYQKLLDIFNKVYKKSNFNLKEILQNYFGIEKESEIEYIQLFRNNFVTAKERMDESLQTDNFQVTKVMLHGGFPYLNGNIIFKKEIVPHNVVIIFLNSINRMGFVYKNSRSLNKKFSKLYKVKTKDGSQSKDGSKPKKFFSNFFSKLYKKNPKTKNIKELLANLLCIDKFTKRNTNLPYNNSILEENTLLTDAQIYLPGQYYPDLNLSNKGENIGAFIEKNNNKTLLDDKFPDQLVSIYLDTLSKSEPSKKMHYVFFYSCRLLDDIVESKKEISIETKNIYMNEFLTYNLNLLLSSCNNKLYSQLFSSQNKLIPKINNKINYNNTYTRYQQEYMLKILLFVINDIYILLTKNFPEYKAKLKFKMYDVSELKEKIKLYDKKNYSYNRHHYNFTHNFICKIYYLIMFSEEYDFDDIYFPQIIEYYENDSGLLQYHYSFYKQKFSNLNKNIENYKITPSYEYKKMEESKRSYFNVFYHLDIQNNDNDNNIKTKSNREFRKQLKDFLEKEEKINFRQDIYKILLNPIIASLFTYFIYYLYCIYKVFKDEEKQTLLKREARIFNYSTTSKTLPKLGRTGRAIARNAVLFENSTSLTPPPEEYTVNSNA
jgi:hypothetical protein